MFTYKISLHTGRDVAEFVSRAIHIGEAVRLSNGEHFEVNGKSLLSALWASTWNCIYCNCETDISEQMDRFICKDDIPSEL